mmetsp:Transcript_22222/g.48400  ORF Transcript_22222/g.48400 Transcript_22222/m.48400 type:complete len:91 (-) Transcript_22222:1868-2140(-)
MAHHHVDVAWMAALVPVLLFHSAVVLAAQPYDFACVVLQLSPVFLPDLSPVFLPDLLLVFVSLPVLSPVPSLVSVHFAIVLVAFVGLQWR